MALRLRFGPLRWSLEAHGAAGEEMLEALAGNLRPSRFRSAPHRVVHLLERRPGRGDVGNIIAGRLPGRLAPLAGGPLPRRGWSFKADDCGYLTAWHPASPHVFLVRGALEGTYAARFWLPWAVLALDASALGGGVFHGGLAAAGGRAFIVTAPAGGGKTTTLGRLAPPWEVPCDDACLVWPAGRRFLASPLPTYGVMLGGEAPPNLSGPWDPGRSYEVAGVLFVRKARRARLLPLAPVRAARPLYLAFSEHPGVLLVRDRFRERLFRAACALARAVPSRLLEASRKRDLLPPPGELFRRD